MYSILVYEPEAIVSLDLQKILHDYKISREASLRGLLDRIRANKFDLLIINVSRLDGWTHLTALLRKCRVPVVIISSFSKKHFGNILKKDDLVLEFPFDSSEVLEAVSSLLPAGAAR